MARIDYINPEFAHTREEKLQAVLWAGECLKAQVEGTAKPLGERYARNRVRAWGKALEQYLADDDHQP